MVWYHFFWSRDSLCSIPCFDCFFILHSFIQQIPGCFGVLGAINQERLELWPRCPTLCFQRSARGWRFFSVMVMWCLRSKTKWCSLRTHFMLADWSRTMTFSAFSGTQGRSGPRTAVMAGTCWAKSSLTPVWRLNRQSPLVYEFENWTERQIIGACQWIRHSSQSWWHGQNQTAVIVSHSERETATCKALNLVLR